MKLKKFLFHIAVTLVILFGGLLLIGFLQTGRLDGLQLVGLAGAMLVLGVVVVVRGLSQTGQKAPDEAGASQTKKSEIPLGSGRSSRSKARRQLRRK